MQSHLLCLGLLALLCSAAQGWDNSGPWQSNAERQHIPQIVKTPNAMLVFFDALPANANDAAFGSFPAPAWRDAPSQDPRNWSRESLLARLPTGEQMRQQDRATIIARLGMPDSSAELYSPGRGRHARLDSYSLSAKNDRVLRIDYDADDRLESDAVEASSCGCPLCSEAPLDTRTMVGMDALARTVLKASDHAVATTKGRVERLLGHAGRPYAATQQVGGRAWTGYGEIWRIAGPVGRFFIASGEMTVRDRRTRQDSELPITSYAIITVGPDCPSK